MPLQCYVNRQSTRHGESLEIFSNGEAPVDLYVAPLFDAENPVYTRAAIAPQAYPPPSLNPFAEGYGWPVTDSFTIGDDWPPGFYFARISNSDGIFYAGFVVKQRETQRSTNLVVVNTNTWAAYNRIGGASFYGYKVRHESRYGKPQFPKRGSSTLSFMRPIRNIDNDIRRAIPYIPELARHKEASLAGRNPAEGERAIVEHLLFSEILTWTWLKAANIGFDLCTDHDLHVGRIPRTYKNVILAGHPEYWSEEMFANLCHWIGPGRNFIAAAGNAIHRRVKFMGPRGAMRLVKAPTEGIDAQRFLWSPIRENDGQLPAASKIKPDTVPAQVLGQRYNPPGLNTFAPYEVLKPDHWALKGLRLAKGDHIGNANFHGAGACGYETDKSVLGDAPVIARGLNSNGGGGDIMLHTVNGGLVFTAGSVAYCGSLHVDPVIAGLTRNVLEKFGA